MQTNRSASHALQLFDNSAMVTGHDDAAFGESSSTEQPTGPTGPANAHYDTFVGLSTAGHRKCVHCVQLHSVNSALIVSHTRTVVRDCCKGDQHFGNLKNSECCFTATIVSAHFRGICYRNVSVCLSACVKTAKHRITQTKSHYRSLDGSLVF